MALDKTDSFHRWLNQGSENRDSLNTRFFSAFFLSTFSLVPYGQHELSIALCAGRGVEYLVDVSQYQERRLILARADRHQQCISVVCSDSLQSNVWRGRVGHRVPKTKLKDFAMLFYAFQNNVSADFSAIDHFAFLSPWEFHFKNQYFVAEGAEYVHRSRSGLSLCSTCITRL